MTYFRAETRAGGEVLVPLERAHSGWSSAGQIRGTAVSGALARGAERAAGELAGAAGLRPVRWTLDLFRPAAMVPSTVETTVVRNGRRLRLVDAALVQDGRTVAQARLLLLATGAAAPGQAWVGPAPQLPAVPDVRPAGADRALYYSAGTGWTTSPRPHRNADRKAAWHVPLPIVEGSAVTPFQHAATVADSSNLAASWGTVGVAYINADVTLVLDRIPAELDGIGVVAERRVEHDGVAVGTTTLFDRTGPLGTVLVSTLANAAHTVDPGAGFSF